MISTIFMQFFFIKIGMLKHELMDLKLMFKHFSQSSLRLTFILMLTTWIGWLAIYLLYFSGLIYFGRYLAFGVTMRALIHQTFAYEALEPCCEKPYVERHRGGQSQFKNKISAWNHHWIIIIFRAYHKDSQHSFLYRRLLGTCSG